MGTQSSLLMAVKLRRQAMEERELARAGNTESRSPSPTTTGGENPSPAGGPTGPAAKPPGGPYSGPAAGALTPGPGPAQGQPSSPTGAANGIAAPGQPWPARPPTPGQPSPPESLNPAPVVPSIVVGPVMGHEASVSIPGLGPGDDELEEQIRKRRAARTAFLSRRVQAAEERAIDPNPVPSGEDAPTPDPAGNDHTVPVLPSTSGAPTEDPELVSVPGSDGAGLGSENRSGETIDPGAMGEVRVERSEVRGHPVGVIRNYFDGFPFPDDLEEVELYETRVSIDPWTPQCEGRSVSPLDSAVRRMGGKNVLKDQLTDWFPDCHTYVEPFMGSLQVLLHRRQRAKIEIVNDWDGDLVSFFRWVQRAPELLADTINSTPKSEALVMGFRSQLERRELKGIARAVAWYFHNCASVNATGSGTGYASSPHTTWNPRVDRRHLKQLSDRLRGTEIRNTSYRRIIESANKPVEGRVGFYLDPPYDETAGYSTMAEGSTTFGKAQQRDLFELCKEIHKVGNWFIQTNKYTEFMHALYSKVDGFHINERMVRYSVAGDADKRKDEREIIISNFPLTSRSRPKMF